MQLPSSSAPPKLSEFILAGPEALFSHLGGRFFLVGKRVLLAETSEHRADLLALDGEGRSVLFVLPCGGDRSLLGAALEGAGLLARWEPARFSAVLDHDRWCELENFLGGETAHINHDLRVVLVSESPESETPAAAKWLAESHGIDIRCVRGALGTPRAGEAPSLQCVSVYPEPPVLEPADQPTEEAATRPPPLPVARNAPASVAQVARDEPETAEDVEPSPFPLRPSHFTAAAAVGSVLALAAISLLLPDSPNRPALSVSPVEVAASPRTVVAGIVADEETEHPIAGAKLYYAGRRVTTAADGRFAFEQPRAGGRRLFAKAPGYRRAEQSDQGRADTLRLTPIEVRGIYLSSANLARPDRLARVDELIAGGLINTVVVGVKSPRGYLGLPVEHELARTSRAAAAAAESGLAGQVRVWKRRGVYAVAHVGVFRDHALANARPDLALRSLKTNQIVRDASGTPWTDPASKLVRNYNIAVARAAAAAGFDEVQFDFIRYPASKLSAEGITAAGRAQRLENVTTFLREASAALAPDNVYVAATVLGSVCSMRRVSFVGQKLEEIAAEVDYICPMLYPSSFAGSEADLMERAYPLVRENLEAAVARLGGDGKKLRPWLQNFPNPGDRKRPLSAATLRSQWKGAVDGGASGWMFWDPATRYTNGLRAAARLP